MHSTLTPLLLSVIWGALIVFVWRLLLPERHGMRSIVAVVGGLTCLLIFRVGHDLFSAFEKRDRVEAELESFHSAPALEKVESEAQKPEIREIKIRVTEAGALTVDGRAFDDAALKVELAKLAGEGPQTVFTILADEFAPYQRAEDVLNLLAETKIENVTFEVPEQK